MQEIDGDLSCLHVRLPKSGRWRRDALSDNALVKCQSVRPVTSCCETRMRFPLETVCHSIRSAKLFQALARVGYQFVIAHSPALITSRDEAKLRGGSAAALSIVFPAAFDRAAPDRFGSSSPPRCS